MNTALGYSKLKGFLAENGIAQKDVAEELGLTEQSFSAKINRNGQDFTLNQVRVMCEKYDLDANEIFLI